MPIIAGQLVNLRAATDEDLLALAPVYASVRDVSYISTAVPRPDKVERSAEEFAAGLKSITPSSSVRFAVVAREDDRFCGVVDVCNVDLHHRSVCRRPLGPRSS